MQTDLQISVYSDSMEGTGESFFLIIWTQFLLQIKVVGSTTDWLKIFLKKVS